jgi:hypothetical protein
LPRRSEPPAFFPRAAARPAPTMPGGALTRAVPMRHGPTGWLRGPRPNPAPATRARVSSKAGATDAAA